MYNIIPGLVCTTRRGMISRMTLLAIDRVCGVVVSRLLRKQKAPGSIPGKSMLFLFLDLIFEMFYFAEGLNR